MMPKNSSIGLIVLWLAATTGPTMAQSVAEVQRALNTLGYNVGDADGKAGRKTRTMSEAFQRAYGYRATGRLNREAKRDVVSLANDARDEKRIIIRPTYPRIDLPTRVEQFQGGRMEYPSLTYANGYHAAQQRHRKIFISDNKYRGNFFEFNTKVEKWQWQRATEYAKASGHEYAQALVVLAAQYAPIPDFAREVLPAIEIIVKKAKENPDQPAYTYRALKSFDWQWDQGNACNQTALKPRAQNVLRGVLDLFQGNLRLSPLKGSFLQRAADCLPESEATLLRAERSRLGTQLDPKTAAITSRDTAALAFKSGDKKVARIEYQRMHELIKDRRDDGYSIQPLPGAVADVAEITNMRKLGMVEAVEEAYASMFKDFQKIPADQITDATISGDLLREVIADFSMALVSARQVETLKKFGLYLSSDSDPWAGVAQGLGAFITRAMYQDAADGAAFFAPLAAQGEHFQEASVIATTEAEAAIRLGAMARAEAALSRALAWGSEVEISENLRTQINGLRSELGLSQAEASNVFEKKAPQLARYFNKACASDVLGIASDLWVPIDMNDLAYNRQKASIMIEAGVLDAMNNCPKDHSAFTYQGELYCHLSVVNGQVDAARSYIRNALASKWSKLEGSLSCAKGLAATGRKDVLEEFTSQFDKLGEDGLLLAIASRPLEQRNAEIKKSLTGHVSPDDFNSPDFAQFLLPMNKKQRKEALETTAQRYVIANSGASARAYEYEAIYEQAYQEANAWLRLGLPEVAQAYLAIDSRVDAAKMPGKETGWGVKILANRDELRLVETHARIAFETRNHQRARQILDPIIDTIIIELTSQKRAFPATVEQFATRGSVLLQIWLDATLSDNENDDRIILAQQVLVQAGSNAGVSALDERLRAADQNTLREYQDARRALRILQNRPSGKQNSDTLTKLTNRVLALSKEMETVLQSGGGAFGVILQKDDIQQRLKKLDAELLLVTQSESSLILSWIDGQSSKHKRVVMSEQEMRRRVDALRSSILSQGSDVADFDKTASKEFYKLLIGWTGKPIGNDVRFVLDGPTTSIPLAAMTTEEGAWLGAVAKIRLSPTVAWALEPDVERPASSQKFLGIGAAIFSDDPTHGEPLEALPETEIEVRFLAKALGGDAVEDVLIADDATEAALSQLSQSGELAKIGMISFATHGLLGNSQRQSALALTPGTGSTSDGLLTVNDIFKLRMNAKLVILSACDTGVPGAGEGLSDLASAFFYAGAGSLMVSHWPVDSGGALELMRNFALSSVQQSDVAENLRLSISNMTQSDGAFSHPRYWAAFFIVG